VVAPGLRMSFRLIFSRRRFDASAISRLLDDVVQVLSAIATDPERRLATLWPIVAEDGRKPMVNRP
jgi:hypothetical protein